MKILSRIEKAKIGYKNTKPSWLIFSIVAISAGITFLILSFCLIGSAPAMLFSVIGVVCFGTGVLSANKFGEDNFFRGMNAIKKVEDDLNMEFDAYCHKTEYEQAEHWLARCECIDWKRLLNDPEAVVHLEKMMEEYLDYAIEQLKNLTPEKEANRGLILRSFATMFYISHQVDTKSRVALRLAEEVSKHREEIRIEISKTEREMRSKFETSDSIKAPTLGQVCEAKIAATGGDLLNSLFTRHHEQEKIPFRSSVLGGLCFATYFKATNREKSELEPESSSETAPLLEMSLFVQ